MTNPSMVFYINQKLNTLKCAIKLENTFNINDNVDI